MNTTTLTKQIIIYGSIFMILVVILLFISLHDDYIALKETEAIGEEPISFPETQMEDYQQEPHEYSDISDDSVVQEALKLINMTEEEYINEDLQDFRDTLQRLIDAAEVVYSPHEPYESSESGTPKSENTSLDSSYDKLSNLE